jgi:hypothetical protein
MASFHYYPSIAQFIDAPPNVYSRAVPLACDTMEFDTLGSLAHFDTVNHCYVADVPHIALFHGTVLIVSPKSGGTVNCWFYKNVLPLPNGSSNGEISGDDCPIFSSQNYPMTARTTRRLALAIGDKVWLVPGCPGGGQLSGAMNGGNNTTNYFEGNIIELL